jgi:hypothetical protein
MKKSEICKKVYESLRDHPEQWSGKSDNEYLQYNDFEFFCFHNKSRICIWIANGMSFIDIRIVENALGRTDLPTLWKWKIWRIYKKNKPKMQGGNQGECTKLEEAIKQLTPNL